MKLSLLVGLMTGLLWAGGSRLLLVSPPELKEAWQECAREHIEKCRHSDRRLFHQPDLVDDARKSATYHQGICEINLLGDPTLQVK